MNQQEAVAYLLGDRKALLETLFEVETKDREIVPFKLNHIQDRMLAESDIRDVYVKPGQIGGTTLFVADFLADNLTINGTVSIIISYDEWVAKRQLIKAKKMYNNLHRKIPTIAAMDHDAAEHLSFEDKKTGFYSDFYIYSARSSVFGRGEAIHNLLLDEFAFFPVGTPETIMAGPLQRVPLSKRTKVRAVSTANGEDNAFYEMYMAAKEGKLFGRSVYKHHFYPWWIHDEYEMSEDSEFCLPGDNVYPLRNLQPDEARLAIILQAAGMREPQIHRKLRWKRYKRVEVSSLYRSGKSMFIFEQEYPEDDESCFVSAGDMRYDVDMIREKSSKCYPAPSSLPLNDPKRGISTHADVWELPNEHFGYILSIDPGKGKTSEAVAHVWRFVDESLDKGGTPIPPRMIHCATLAGLYEEDEMGGLSKDLGRKYNYAVLCPEDNLDLVSHIKDYPELYYREDPTNNKVGMSIGWQTNTNTKPYMVTEVSRNMQYIECFDQRFWSQCRNIRKDPESRSGLKVIGADDHHDAGALAIVCRSAQPAGKGYVGGSGDTGGWGETWGR